MLLPVIVLSILLFCTGFLLIKSYILIEYVRMNEDDNAVISIFTAGGLIRRKWEVPLINLTSEGIESRMQKKKGKNEKAETEEEKIFGIREFIERYRYISKLRRHNYGAVKYLRKKLKIKEFDLNLVIGTGDAFQTAILAGVAWGAVGVLTSLVSGNYDFKKSVNIKTTFTEKKFDVDLYCIFSIRNVHIIVVVFKFAASQFKRFLEAKKILGGDLSG